MPTRRSVLKQLAWTTTASIAGTFFYTFKIGPQHLKIRELSVALPGLPESWEGKRIAHISDLHVGDRVDDEYLKHCLQRLPELQPDMVAITGDFMDCEGDEQILTVRDILSVLAAPERGIIGVLGNHDYARNWQRPDVADDLTTELRDLGIDLLRNEKRAIEGLEICGFDDLWAGNFRPQEIMADLSEDTTHLALTHNPDTVDTKHWDRFRGLILAGHTHGGQCKPPFLPPPLLPVSNRRYTKGMFSLDPQRTLHINPAIGHLTKVRFNCCPEISMLTLRRAAPVAASSAA